MGYVKEPKGVDFIIQSKPLTDEERKGISKFIQDYKEKHAKKRSRKARLLHQNSKLQRNKRNTSATKVSYVIANKSAQAQRAKYQRLGITNT